ncbi:NBS-LRR resistance protein [Corchorus olitorius]|uniref:NBS-LRR resistance protein n=1 Tax=Corchorus olitorius TaxID=93759 RepID=A0A1R3IR77_9ROSI|nr:NBS-LRR resistance protein [Corchorus olitorius]
MSEESIYTLDTSESSSPLALHDFSSNCSLSSKGLNSFSLLWDFCSLTEGMLIGSQSMPGAADVAALGSCWLLLLLREIQR